MASTDAIQIELVRVPPDPGSVTSTASSDKDGAVAAFVGTVRDRTDGRTVTRLDFEAYEPMALKELHKIAAAARERYSLSRVVIHHYLGTAPIGTVVVVIAVSAPHRREVFAACQYCIDTLKQTVPIWKKEYFKDGEVWVSATP